MTMPTSKPFFMNLLLENNYGVPSQNFVKKNVLCEKGDEITRFDGTLLERLTFSNSFYLCLDTRWQPKILKT
jgi:hypothetical protein